MTKTVTVLLTLWLLVTAVVIAMILSTAPAVTAPASAPAKVSKHAPYGGCDEAWQMPDSKGAKWCAKQAKRNKRHARRP